MSLPDVESSITLASSPRLARWILFQYAQRQKSRGLRSWCTPTVLPLNAWMRQLWVSSWPDRFILSHLQSRHLWESIIQRDSTDLLHLKETAGCAAQAYSLLQQYWLPLESKNFNWTSESSAFHRWARIYQKRLQEWNALDPSTLIDEIYNAMRMRKITLTEKRVILAGFDSISPQLNNWAEFLQAHGLLVERWPKESPSLLESNNYLPEVRPYADPGEEIVQCARWVRTQYLPEKTIGIVVPDLSRKRTKILRELAAELAPDSIFPWLNKNLTFTLSSGRPLNQEPVIQLALAMLATSNFLITVETFSLVLGTPFLIGGLSESALRNQLDWKLRQSFRVDLNEIDPLLEEYYQLKGIITSWREYISKEDRQFALGWASQFAQFLRHIGWPTGDGSMTDRLNQVYDAWTQCLDAFASLDRVLGPMNRTAASTILTRIIDEKSFKLKTQEQPIQVMDLRETDGMHFDSLWVLGFTDESFPQKPSPNPFIPTHLQKKYNMPHCSSDWEIRTAEQKFSQLLSSAKKIVFSYPEWEQQVKTSISPLLKRYPPKTIRIERSHRLINCLNSIITLETWKEPATIFSNQDEAQSKFLSTQTNARILQDQAACPFRAFATHRLNVEARPALETDFDSKDRGTVIHRVLERIWGTVKNRSNLDTLNRENKLKETIHKAVQEATKPIFETFFFQSQPRFASIEKEYIAEMIQKWLKFELNRPDFEVILREHNEQIFLGGLTFHFRIDRLDRLPDGREILIDYKTGAIEPKDWFRERIQAPQLPLYALKFRPQAIVLASIQNNEKKLELRAAMDPSAHLTALKKVDYQKSTGCSDWNELMQYWKNHLTDRVHQFLDGRAEVDPFQRNQTCRHCGLETLCRVNELSETEEGKDETQ